MLKYYEVLKCYFGYVVMECYLILWMARHVTIVTTLIEIGLDFFN